jgi:hypothetical protein
VQVRGDEARQRDEDIAAGVVQGVDQLTYRANISGHRPTSQGPAAAPLSIIKDYIEQQKRPG